MASNPLFLITRWEKYRLDARYAPNDLIDDTVSALTTYSKLSDQLAITELVLVTAKANERIAQEKYNDLHARLEEIKKQPTVAWLEFGIDGTVIDATLKPDDYAKTLGVHPLIERPEFP